jgi:predicted DNA-binding antitoxin AbrB/MazE fold protein
MKAIKGIYEDGQIKLLQEPPIKKRLNVLVIFPDDIAWQDKISKKKSQELVDYFINCRTKTEPLRCSVKSLINEGRT